MPPRKSLKRKASESSEDQQDRQQGQGQPAQQVPQDQTAAAAAGYPDARETFGALFDALDFDTYSNDQESLRHHRRTWQLRRDLAELSRRPEGSHYTWLTSDGRTVRAPILTPPSFEAVQREDGSWYRVPRLAGALRPYSQAWYREYLRRYGLPPYFLRPGHLSMLFDDDESTILQEANVASREASEASSRDFLEAHYPATPFWPQPGQSVYRLEDLSTDRRANLARHHPAIGVTSFPHNVFVFPEGNIQLRTRNEPDDCPTLSEFDVNWVELNADNAVPSSYHRESTAFHPLSHANQSSIRESLIQEAINNHAIINPMEDIPGLGELSFLSDGDRLEAQRRGYASAHDVSMARRRGDLAVGTGINAGPVVLFRPDPETLNPVEEPQGPGAWHFLTSDGETSNANLATINFGGSRGLPARPSAGHIRQLGQLFRQEGRTDLTAEIDLVWVPGAEAEEEDVDMALNEADLLDDEEEEVEEEEEEEGELHPTQSSPRYTHDGLMLDPTNNGGVRGGPHDQTGAWAEYQTGVKLGGRTITIDRSRAWHNHPEPHKLESYGAGGWKKWKYASTMDWTSKAEVSKLNKFREQTHKRGKWPLLRDVERKDYTPEELEHVMDLAKAAGDKRLKMEGKLAKEFYLRFPLRAQSDTGLQSLYDRLVKELKEYGGLKPRMPRGWKQKQQSKAAIGYGQAVKSKNLVESDESGEDDDGEGDDGEEGEDADKFGDEDSEEDGDEAEA